MQESFQDLLRHCVTESGYTVEEWCIRRGLTPRTVRDIAAGRVRRPHPRTLSALARAMRELGGNVSQRRGRIVAAITTPSP